MDKTFTEQQLFDAIETVTTRYVEAAAVLDINVESEALKARFKIVNDVMEELGFSRNAVYVYLLNKKQEEQ